MFICTLMKKLKHEIKTVPITNTKNNGIEGAECNFVELLTEVATKSVSLYNFDSLTNLIYIYQLWHMM